MAPLILVQSLFSFLIFVVAELGLLSIGMFMEHWRLTSIPSVMMEDDEIPRSSRILASTSGNARTYALDTKEGAENRNPANNDPLLPTLPKTIPSQYPAGPILSSNSLQASLQRLHARRQRREYAHRYLAGPPRPYLERKKYIDYRNRQRQDTGLDGKPVWDNFTEDAFQEGK